MQKIRKGDNVKVMRGKDAGVVGEVLKFINRVQGNGVQRSLVVVRGANKVKRHNKPNPTLNLPGGILEVEKPIDVSNVMLVDPKDSKKVSRIGIDTDTKTGKVTRIAKKSGTKIK